MTETAHPIERAHCLSCDRVVGHGPLGAARIQEELDPSYRTTCCHVGVIWRIVTPP